MTAQVPWLHASGRVESGKTWKYQYFQIATTRMKQCSMYANSRLEDIPYVEMGPERMQKFMCLEEHEIYTFTKDGNYPDKEDVGRDLEDMAVKVTCKALGWEIPSNWREERERQSKMRCIEEVFDLTRWDAMKRGEMVDLEGGSGNNKRMRYTVDSHDAALNAACRDSGSGDDGDEDDEEKKDSFHDNHHHDTRVQQQQDSHVEQQQQQQMSYSIDAYDTIIPLDSKKKNASKRDSFHERYEEFEPESHDYDDDTGVIDENEQDQHCPVLGYGYEYVEQQYEYENVHQQQQQHNDSFYDESTNVIGEDDNEDGQLHEKNEVTTIEI